MLQKYAGTGLTVNSCDSMSRTPLHNAAAEGMLECVKLLINKGAEPNAKDSWDATPLDDALRFGRKEVETYLLESGAQMGNLKISARRLFQAIDDDDSQTMRSMIESGTPVRVTDADNRTALHHAAAKGDVEIIEYLIAKGATLDAVDNFGLTLTVVRYLYAARTQL